MNAISELRRVTSKRVAAAPQVRSQTRSPTGPALLRCGDCTGWRRSCGFTGAFPQTPSRRRAHPVLSQFFYAALRTMGITALARRLRDGGVVLGYHNVIPSEDGADALGLHLPFHRFAAQVHW